MKVNLSIWDRLTPVVIFLVFVAGVLLVGFWYLPLIKQNQRMRKEVYRLQKMIREHEETARQLHTSIDALRFDPKAVERLARETLGYAKPGETVVRFEEPRTNSASKR
ncbi:MAG TPA: septum formation initiator family protein [Candidatus Paceibacterota bacterium]|nr:septum formation initiator family protein [Verrucomicrobiota bacterium]HSA10160.1 septum formation initiator family protein [Candidatus Paceibacterota bacterium]